MKSLTLDQCADRMSRFLAKKPSKQKTRAYVASLGKRAAIKVTAADYAAQASLGKPCQLKRDQDRYDAWVARGKPPSPSVAPKARKDRRRPLAEKRSLIERLMEATANHCGICGVVNELWQMDVDHVVPRAAGGPNERNRVPAHCICNRKKADRMPTGCERVWLEVVNAVIYKDTPHDPQ